MTIWQTIPKRGVIRVTRAIFNFNARNHISETPNFCTHVKCINCYPFDDRSHFNGRGQGQVTCFFLIFAPIISHQTSLEAFSNSSPPIVHAHFRHSFTLHSVRECTDRQETCRCITLGIAPLCWRAIKNARSLRWNYGMSLSIYMQIRTAT